MGWEKEYEHWRDYGHTWGLGLNDDREPTPEERKEIQAYKDLKSNLSIEPRNEVRIIAKELEKLVPKSGEGSLNWRETYSNEKLDQAKNIAQSLGYELTLQDGSVRDENKFMVAIDYYGYIPNRGGNLHKFSVSNIKSIQDCLQLVADFSALGYWPTTWYKNNHITLRNTGELRLEMKRWGFPLEEIKKPSIDEQISAASPRATNSDSIDRSTLRELDYMNRNPILIQEAETPYIFVNGDKYELLCEFESKDSVIQNIFIQVSGSDVLVEIGKEKAIVGLFSIEESKLKLLFDYMEASISPNNGLICYESESFPRLLNHAIQSGGRFPLIEKEITPQPFISGLLKKFHFSCFLNTGMLEKIQEHMVPVSRSYMQSSEINTDDSMYYEPESSFSPAISLPNGWVWKDCDDGNGHLESPDGQCFFSYDCSKCNFPNNSEGIEYKKTAAEHYEFYIGTLPEFKAYAESFMNDRILNKKLRLNDHILSANDRAMLVQNSSEAKVINKEHEI